jgi:hypothetical protein
MLAIAEEYALNSVINHNRRDHRDVSAVLNGIGARRDADHPDAERSLDPIAKSRHNGTVASRPLSISVTAIVASWIPPALATLRPLFRRFR